ncbi:MAG TPA: hypothetical protein VIA80_02260 [Hyphomonadaceae bacterium]|jgi:hypothetical protein
MAKSVVIPDVTARATGASASKKRLPNSLLAGRAMMWTAVLLVSAATVIPITTFALRELKVWSLIQADEPAIRAELASEWPRRASGAWLETLAELAIQVDPQDTDHALLAAVRATRRDSSRAGAWALQAYLEARKAKRVNAAALEALSNSMAACPLCSQELIRWRFNFVLANWAAIPDDIRRKAFEQADILRWMGDNGEFLAEMRIKAKQAGIPFDEYRSAVNTPVRTWDLEPAGTRNPPESASE